MKMHSCWNRWQFVHRPSSEASKPEQRICKRSAHVLPHQRCDGPLYVSDSIDTQWQSAASVPAGSHTDEVEEGHASDPEGGRRTCRREEDDDSSPALGAGGEVE